MLLADPVLEELNRRAVAQRGVAASPVVEDRDVVEQVAFGVATGLVDGAMNPLVLQAVEEALARRVIPAIPLAAHRANHAVFGQPGLEHMTRVLAAPLRVVVDFQWGRRAISN